ncbi:hypothetical protein CRP01_38330 [Flavilitoribacter nigricans DSM 23189 = NBRC 102662]|uniref:Uncharacterized protein n=1 Tax=Flavilitoribacter nigricans (strain ATCC 23147 / DSM 23189 / NBRC 102662 / NCIMB 1420 / SS-2) TaxID=1122177 RepID=A0A2D0N0G2_FLAN2|nr:hypothetical protein CRP01_38330 [Flavilitoribacter nigricans DSM 23189 = NBRC 102662]
MISAGMGMNLTPLRCAGNGLHASAMRPVSTEPAVKINAPIPVLRYANEMVCDRLPTGELFKTGNVAIIRLQTE